MVRHVTRSRFRGWKGTLAVFVGLGAVAWQVMACVESPMSFSPTGDLAFVVMDPYGGPKNFGLAGEAVYRLMVLSKDRELREIERTSSHMLTAPAYSPDGEQFAYLRIPLLTPEDKTRIEAFIKERKEQYEQATSGSAAEKWIFMAPEDSIPGRLKSGMKDWDDAGLPRLEQFEEVIPALQAGGGLMPADLVVRQASTGELVESLAVDVPIFEEGKNYIWSYLLTRPQYGPDGQWVYFGMNYFALAANPATGEKRLLAVNTVSPLLSPDGQTLASIFADSLGFLETDGERAAYAGVRSEVSFSGLAWAGNDSLVVLREEGKEEKKAVLDVYDVDGHLLRSQTLPFSAKSGGNSSGELAVSPDGEYMAISYGKSVYFLTGDGQVLGSWQPAEASELLVQPTFTPDSRQVAFKLLAEEKTRGKTWGGTVAIVFFTTEGRELFRVPLPRAARDEAPEPPAPATEELDQ